MAKRTKPPADQEAADRQDAPPRRRAPLLVVILVVLVVGAAGGAYVGGVFGGGDAQAAEPEATPTVPELGPITELDAITVNLADGHFLKVGVALEHSAEAGAAELPTAPAYDQVIALFAGQTMADLATPEQRAAAKDALLARVAAVYGTDVAGLYFTEFVMQ